MATEPMERDAVAASPPPSPPPPPPEDSSAGKRATLFLNAFDGAIDATLRKCSYDNFAACFPTPSQYRPQTLEMFHKDFTGRLNQVCKTEFQNIVKDRNIVPLLNSLDRLIVEARLRKQAAEGSADGKPVEAPVAPHTLPPSDLVNAHLAPFLLDMKSQVTAETTNLEANNAKLIETIKQQRQEMEVLVSGLESVVADLENTAAMVQGDEVQGLTAEVRMVEEELKG